MREVALEEEIHLIISATFTTEIGPIWVFVAKKKGFSRLTYLLSTRYEHNIIEELIEQSEGLIVACSSFDILSQLNNNNMSLYAAITPVNFEAATHAKNSIFPHCYRRCSVY